MSSAQFCRVRATRINCDGVPIPGATAAWIGDSGINVEITPEIQQGEDTQIINGCGCTCASLKTPDRFKRWNVKLEVCTLNPNQIELFTGSSLLTGVPAANTFPGAGADVIGNAWAEQSGCAYDPCGFALDVWTKAWDDDAQRISPTRYIQWHFPKIVANSIGDMRFENGIATFSFTGFSRTNDQYGNPWADMPASAVGNTQNGGWWVTDIEPAASCEFVTLV